MKYEGELADDLIWKKNTIKYPIEDEGSPRSQKWRGTITKLVE